MLNEKSSIDERASVLFDYLKEDPRSEFTFEELSSLVARDAGLLYALRPDVTVSLEDYVKRVLALGRPGEEQMKHESFLREFDALRIDKEFGLLPLIDHALATFQDRFEHYSRLDGLFQELFQKTEIIWRFTSTPSAEKIFLASDVTPSEVVETIAKHSGGAEKSNARVLTLSFGRNPGALFGTALSGGGDPHVLNIIDKAAYLYGIDISTLPRKGITAHPAAGRAISLYETEYVLVGTPGMGEKTLDELATMKLLNPFQGEAIKLSEEWGFKSAELMKAIVEEMGNKVAEAKNLHGLPLKVVEGIQQEAYRVAKAADNFPVSIRSGSYIKKSGSEVTEESAYEELQKFRKILTGAISARPSSQPVRGLHSRAPLGAAAKGINRP
ncbi:MAG: hypothetical protein ACRDTG_14550 [Pseudonocardiaceae bacterium]